MPGSIVFTFSAIAMTIPLQFANNRHHNHAVSMPLNTPTVLPTADTHLRYDEMPFSLSQNQNASQ